MNKSNTQGIIWGENKITQQAWNDEKIQRIKLISQLLGGIVFLILGVMIDPNNHLIWMIFFIIIAFLIMLNGIRMYINYKKPKKNQNLMIIKFNINYLEIFFSLSLFL